MPSRLARLAESWGCSTEHCDTTLRVAFAEMQMPLVSHSEVRNIVRGFRQLRELAGAFPLLWRKRTETYQQVLRIVVLVQSHHLPLLAVERIVAGDGVGVRGNLVIDEILRDDLVVVVV